MKPIGLASDHAGYELKCFVRDYLDARGITFVDFGTHSSESCDYPDFGHALGKAIDTGECERGIAICGSGEGISMTLNKHAQVRAALCWMPQIAELARLHNNANVLVMPGRFVDESMAQAIMEAFLNTDFEGGRHIRRVEKISCQDMSQSRK